MALKCESWLNSFTKSVDVYNSVFVIISDNLLQFYYSSYLILDVKLLAISRSNHTVSLTSSLLHVSVV